MDLKGLHPADAADQLQRMPVEEALAALRQFSKADAAAVLAELDEELRPRLIEGLSSPELAGIITQLDHDEAADVVSELPAKRRPEVMAGLPTEEKKQVDTLLVYQPDTVGGIMTDQFIQLDVNQTVEQCLQMLQGK